MVTVEEDHPTYTVTEGYGQVVMYVNIDNLDLVSFREKLFRFVYIC